MGTEIPKYQYRLLTWGGFYNEEHKQKHGETEGRILYRPAEFKHRLDITPGKPAWTFVITFKKVREWGFWTPAGFVKWYEYSSQTRC